MPPFRIQLDTALPLAVTQTDFSSTVAVVHTAGGTDVSVFQNDGQGRAEFSVEVADRADALLAAQRVLAALAVATPLLVGGWVLASITVA